MLRADGADGSKPGAVGYTALPTLHAQQGQFEGAKRCREPMVTTGVRPNVASYTAVVRMATQESALLEA